MKFKCLINLLEEKGLIKIKRREDEDICISVNIYSEYKEVLDKIIDNLPAYTEYHKEGDKVTIMTFQDVYDWVKRHMQLKGTPVIHLKLEAHFMYEERELFKSIVKRINDFKYEYEPWKSQIVKLTDVKWLNQIEIEEEKKHKEVVDFLNSLP